MDIPTDKLSTYGHNMFILYLTIAGSFIVSLVSCRFQNAIQNSLILKHVFGFMTLFFFAILASDNTSSPTHHFLMAAVVYMWFVITTKTHVAVTFTIVGMLFLSYILNAYVLYFQQQLKQMPDETLLRRVKQLQTAQAVTQYIIVAITAVGFLHFLISNVHSNINRQLFKVYDKC